MQHFDPLFSLKKVKKGFIRPQMLALEAAAQAAAAVAAAAVEPTRLASGRVRQVSPEPHFRFHKPTCARERSLV